MARTRPTPEDATTARRILLDGLPRDARVVELLGELEPLHPRNDTWPTAQATPRHNTHHGAARDDHTDP